MAALAFTHIDTFIGPLLLAGDDTALRFVLFAENGKPAKPRHDWLPDGAPLGEAVAQLHAWFAGELLDFNLPLAFAGNRLQEAVWQGMCAIPYGETVSYGALARAIGEDVSASRAVGAACGANPLPVVIPCHRVIGADGSLTGFGGGLALKRALLAHERKIRPLPGQQLALF